MRWIRPACLAVVVGLALTVPCEVRADDAEECKPTEEKLVETTALPKGAVLRRFEGACVTACSTGDFPYCGAGGSGARVEIVVGGKTLSAVRASYITVETKDASPILTLGPGAGRGVRLALQHNGPLGGMKSVTQSTEILAVFDGATWKASSTSGSSTTSSVPSCEMRASESMKQLTAERAAKEALCHKTRTDGDAELDAKRRESLARHNSTSATEKADRRAVVKREAECMQDAKDEAYNKGLRTDLSKTACLAKERSPDTKQLTKECATACRRASEAVLPDYCNVMTRSRQYRRALAKTEDESRCREQYDQCLIGAAPLSASQRDAACGGGLSQCRAIRAQENKDFDEQIAQKKSACLANDRAQFENSCLSECAPSPSPEP